MLVARPPLEEQSGADAPAVLFPLAGPLGVATTGAAAAIAIPPDFAPAILQTLPASSAFKPNAALVVSLAMHVGLVAGIIGLATSDFPAGEGDIDTIELVVEQTPEPAVAEPAHAAASPADAQESPTPAQSLAPPAQPEHAEAAQAPPPAAPAFDPPAPTRSAALADPPPRREDSAAAPAMDTQQIVPRQHQDEDHAAEARAASEARRHADEQRRLAAARAAEQRRFKDIARRAAERDRLEAQEERAAAAREAALAERKRVAQRRALQASLGSEARIGADRPAAQIAPPVAQRARAGDTGGFDPASYRALVARAVRAAVGSRCSQAAGARVVIALTIGGSGAISSAAVSSSSGNSAFNSASAAAVRRAGPFPPPTGRAAVSVPVAVSCR